MPNRSVYAKLQIDVLVGRGGHAALLSGVRNVECFDQLIIFEEAEVTFLQGGDKHVMTLNEMLQDYWKLRLKASGVNDGP